MKVNPKMHLNFKREKVPTRNGYGDALVQLGKNKNIMVLCADLKDSTRVLKFAKKYPQQFVEMGVAEQNLVTVASGFFPSEENIFIGNNQFLYDKKVFIPQSFQEKSSAK